MLCSLLKLSTIFLVQPEEGNIHIVVDLPLLQISIEAIKPEEVNDKLVATVATCSYATRHDSVMKIFKQPCHRYVLLLLK